MSLGSGTVDPIDASALNDTLRRLARRGQVRRYARNTLIIQEGDVNDSMFLILSGRLRAFSVDPYRGREITYGIHGEGEFIGEFGIDGGPRTASVMAIEPSICAVVSRRAIEDHIADEPAFAFYLLDRVIQRARAATEQTRQLALDDVYGRLRNLLEELAGPETGAVRIIPERLTQREIAQRIGCTREMVSRLMRDLETGGFVSIEDRRLHLHRRLPLRW